MSDALLRILTAQEAATRDTPLEAVTRESSAEELLEEARVLDDFRRRSPNLYERVRALFFLYSLYEFQVPPRLPARARGRIPYAGFQHLLRRRFGEAIDEFLATLHRDGPNEAVCSALARAYRELGFQTLADQVRRSVRSVRGNQWMFRIGHPADQPLRLRPELLRRDPTTGLWPVLRERTPVRMDFSHSAWSDIFFLGMDYPEGARVLNASIDLCVRGSKAAPRPPVECHLRVLDRPVLRLVSVDLGVEAEIRELPEVFDFARDHLGLLKAAVIGAGIIPPGVEGSEQSLQELLAQLLGPDRGLELVSQVYAIPKGSRLAVSTSLLAGMITACMRATGQARSLTGGLTEEERRIVAARAILGEWLGGSGGGWQDSGGIWPGLKLIEGCLATPGDPEHGISRGRLLPRHTLFSRGDLSTGWRERLQDSLVLVHGGLAQNVGPILEMVTERYLLRSPVEWRARKQAIALMDDILAALRADDVAALGRLTDRNFHGPIQTIIPWAGNAYTEGLNQAMRTQFGPDFLGFWMLGGMSGGGMGFLFQPEVCARAKDALQEVMSTSRRQLQHSLPFAMEPVVYDFAINEQGTQAEFLHGQDALLPRSYYARRAPHWLAETTPRLTGSERAELELLRQNASAASEEQVLRDLLPPKAPTEQGARDLARMLDELGFDREQHDQIRTDLRAGRIGLAQNRLPLATELEDVAPGDILDGTAPAEAAVRRLGEAALRKGQVAVVTLCAGIGSRWTEGAGVVKALHPFARLAGHHRTFIEVHLARSRQVAHDFGSAPAHVLTTSFLTHDPIESYLDREDWFGEKQRVRLSPGRAVGLRLVPMIRDLRFAWEEMAQQVLDEQQQKVRVSLQRALMAWARQAGEGSDYTDNLPRQCLHPVGHWFEVPNLLGNGVLREILEVQPDLRHLFLHNVDTLGAGLDPEPLGRHIQAGGCLTFEVIGRRIEDQGGGLARVNGRPCLIEGLAMPREEDEFRLTFYSSMSTWIDVDQLLDAFGLARKQLGDASAVRDAGRRMAARLPTYVTLKDVKKRWGRGQEDVFPVAQFEKLWGDMSALSNVDSRFLAVPRRRGRQLKEQAQLDGWLRDGTAAWVESQCRFPEATRSQPSGNVRK